VSKNRIRQSRKQKRYRKLSRELRSSCFNAKHKRWHSELHDYLNPINAYTINKGFKAAQVATMLTAHLIFTTVFDMRNLSMPFLSIELLAALGWTLKKELIH
jgi:hypothetical protein